MKEWAVFDQAAVVVKHGAWPGPSLMASAEATAVRKRAAILLALANLSAELARTCPLDKLLQVRLRPVRGVWMEEAAAVGAVILPPETLTVKTTGREAPAPAGGLEVHLDPADPECRFWLLPSVSDKVCVPYWFLRGTSDKAEANVSAEVFKITMLLGHDYDGSIELSADIKREGKARVRSSKKQNVEAAAEAEKAEVLCISIPALVNSVPLAKDAELRHYVAAAQKRSRETAAITLEKAARRKA